MHQEPKSIRYALEVYEPGSADDVLVSFESLGPFHGIAVGDIIESRVWDGAVPPGNVLEVTRVRHVIWETSDHHNHKLMVATKAVTNDRATCRNSAV